MPFYWPDPTAVTTLALEGGYWVWGLAGLLVLGSFWQRSVLRREQAHQAILDRALLEIPMKAPFTLTLTLKDGNGKVKDLHESTFETQTDLVACQDALSETMKGLRHGSLSKSSK